MKSKSSNTKIQHKINRYSRLLWHPAWKCSGHIVKGKDKEKVNKKGKYKQEKNESK